MRPLKLYLTLLFALVAPLAFAVETIAPTDTLPTLRTKLNANFAELSDASDGVSAKVVYASKVAPSIAKDYTTLLAQVLAGTAVDVTAELQAVLDTAPAVGILELV